MIRYKWFISLIIGLLLVLAANSPVMAVHGGSGDKKGAHNQTVVGFKRLVCTYCHFSASGKGENIWSDLPKGAHTLPNSTGVKTVCSSCHYPGNAVNALSGFTMGRRSPHGHTFVNGNVLCDNSLLEIGESHVMAEQVELDPQKGKLRIPLDPIFPLKTNDEQDKDEHDQIAADSGFTCITCHNPHDQPNKDISGNGDYLRIQKEKSAGQADNRTPFCMHCHDAQCQEGTSPKPQHGVSIGCNECHHPHDGFYQLRQQAQLGRAILIDEIDPINFRALPNVAAFDSLTDNTIDQDVSAICYGCHGSTVYQKMCEVGAKLIPGDDCQAPHEHHPMGTEAQLGKASRAPGLKTAALNNQGQVTCTSCHNGFHRGNNLHFLREDFTEDKSTLCTSCHTDKTADGLGLPGAAHHQVAGQSPNQRGECMFCHFIHDGQDQGNQPKPSINTLLRITPLNLAWSDQVHNTHTEDFEDLCFGCHSSPKYMKGTEKQGAMLQPGKYFSHRFSSIPSARLYPTLPISDGDLEKVTDDYGVAEGEIYCGSCHDIHHNANTPYLRGEESPYVSDAFCARCHTKFPLRGRSSHPIGVSPRPGVTADEFPEMVCGGKSGAPRGITSDETPGGQVLCLTCHSIHAARTNFDGRLDLAEVLDKDRGEHGKLLVLDNFSSPSGSDLCRSCHTPYRNIAESRHDFSDLDLAFPLSGVCSPCHIPHGSPEENRLWSRSLAEEREWFNQKGNPNYVKEATLLCYDCHDDHYSVDDDPPLGKFLYPPQDIAFGDGPGRTSKVGFYETIPPGSTGENGVKNPPTDGAETGGHYMKTANLTELSDGLGTGDKLPCNLCHNPHNTSHNEVFFKPPAKADTFDNFKASKNTRNGTGTGREICASCHGYSEPDRPRNTPVRLFDPFFGIEILGTPPQDNYRLEAHRENAYDDKPCTDCHLHNRVAKPEAPRSGPGTHAFHFKSLLAEGEVGSAEMGYEGIIIPSRKLLSTENPQKNCDICHPPDLPFQNGKLVFNDGRTFDQTTVCDTCHSRQGQYDGANGYAYTISDQDHGAKDCWKNGAYELVVDESGNIERQLRPGKEAWCIGCHDNRPSRIKNPDLPEHLWVQAPNIAGDAGETYGFYISGHGLPKQYSYQKSGRAGAGLSCTDCHSPLEAHIVNEQREKGNFKKWQANGSYGFRLKLAMVLPRRSEAYHSSDFKLCFSCHDEASVIGLPPGYRDYTNNQNPYVNLNTKNYPVTRFSNADQRGIYPLRVMGRGIMIDFSVLFFNNSYNIHWNHLALPNADLPEEAVISPQAQESSSNLQRTQSCYSSRCHGGTGIIKLRSTSFWDSDRDGVLDSRPSCPACHNPHGSRYVSMTRNDLAIAHDNPGADWEYGRIGSKEYGAFTDSLDNYNDLYCGECHAQLQRSGSSVIYYPQPLNTLNRDRLAPAQPL